MIGTSDGQQYESMSHYLMGVGASTEPAGAFKSNPGTSGTPEDKGTPEAINSLGPISRDNHVPLVASALTDQDGKMYGMAIDSRIPPKPEYDKHLWNHEAYENDYMNDLVKTGMTSQDAYHKAHDWSTARESAAVTAEFGEKGLEDYKQYWRDASSIAAEPSDKPRHPDAHTTKHGLDESELGQKFAANTDMDKDDRPMLKSNPAKALEAMPGPEKIAAPGIMAHDGTVFTGINHGEAYEKFSTSGKRLAPGGSYDGFLTTKGRFVDRHTAAQIGRKQEQLIPDAKGYYSEDYK